ncbi:hypothetical protein NKH77_55830 [Streptomyces sp. M19]
MSFSVVVVLTVAVLVLLRSGTLRILPALAAIGLGFFLAATRAAGPSTTAPPEPPTSSPRSTSDRSESA